MTLQKNPGAVKRHQRMMRFGQWFQTLPAKMTPAPFRLMQISSAYWQSRALYVVANLDIASVLEQRELSAEEIAARTDTDPDAIFRLMRLMVAMGVFERGPTGGFSNNDVSLCLQDAHPQSVRAMILMHHSDEMSRPWFEKLEDGINTGEPPFLLTHGRELFDYMEHNPAFDARFARAMDTIEALTGDTFATDVDWSQFQRVIDIGGGKGSKSVTLLKHHPNLTALVMDRAQVIDGAMDHWKGKVEPEVLSRLEFTAGDIFERIPAARSNKDVFALSAVLHGFSDDDSVTILSNLNATARRCGARIVVIEMILPDSDNDVSGALFDMQMFMGTRGRERTLKEWTQIVSKAGLRIEEVVSLRSFVSMLVLVAA